MVQIETFLPAFLISQKSEIFASFPPGEAFGTPVSKNAGRKILPAFYILGN